MINTSADLYTFTRSYSLTKVGTLIVKYEIRRYMDVRNLGNNLAYQIRCTQRVVIPNSNSYTLGTQNVTGFSDYPAAITSNIVVSGDAAELVEYWPKTINASVSTSLSSATGSNYSASHQHTSGSSHFSSNSFGASASVGFFGPAPTGGLTVEGSHSWGHEHSESSSSGEDRGRNRQASSGESMSIKDWLCSSYLDQAMSSPTWVWGQEYPWNVIEYNNSGSSTTPGSKIVLPDYVVPLLCDDTQALPPSLLSLFGVDFTMKALWIVRPTKNEVVSFTHTIYYCTANHSYDQGTPSPVTATFNKAKKFKFSSPNIDLYLYGLDPIISTDRIAAIIGFVPNKFVASPLPATSSSAPSSFKILSSANNFLLADTSAYSGLTSADVGAGFSADQTGIKATFTQNCASLQITLSFKIIDTSENYSLFFKHWKLGQTGVTVQIVVNGDSTNPIVKYVDAQEAEGGESNLLCVSLRNQNFGSVDYHDFLQLGLNTVALTISPLTAIPSGPCYQIRAISIEST